MLYWFTADLHLGHENIIKYCNRPFKNLEQMDKILIHNWNQRVKSEDTVIVVGDFCFRGGKEGGKVKAAKYAEQLNGNKVFVKGNHDNHNSLNAIIESMRIKIGGKKIYLTHRPDDVVQIYTDLYFVGHVHQAWKIKYSHELRHDIAKPIINVGVDVWNFMPVNISEVLRFIAKDVKNHERKK